MKFVPIHLHQLFALYQAEEVVSSIRHSVVNDLTALSALCYRLKIEHVIPLAETDSGRSAQDLLENIQAYVKLASRRLEVAFLPAGLPAGAAIDVTAVLQELVARMPAPRGVAVQVQGPEAGQGTPPSLVIDAAELELAVACLLENAFESLDAGAGGRVILRAAAGPHDTVRIEVEDDGTTLGSKARGRVFEPFFSTKPEHLGLGLNIARRIAERWGGTVDFQPNVERGVLSALSLPRVPYGAAA
jgi:signal transduction histidine kinase